jgi:hypothetical protein
VALSFPVKICKREADVRRVQWGLLAAGMAGKRTASRGRCESSAIHGFPVRGGNAYLRFVRFEQQWGLSTPFGWRLTALKMTEN